MAVDMELLGQEVKYSTETRTLDAFVSQADLDVGITVDFMDKEEVRPGAHAICLNRKEIDDGCSEVKKGCFSEAYEEYKRLLLRGHYKYGEFESSAPNLCQQNESVWGFRQSTCAFE